MEKAFLQLLEKHKRLIVKIASAYFKNPIYRDDLLQEITLQLWKAFPKFDQSITSSTWVYKIALNVSISFYRKEQHRQKVLTNYRRTTPIYEFKEAQVTEQLEKLYTLISQLKPIEKAIIILHLEGCRNAEVAEIIGISLSNVSTRINRIKTKLITKTKKSSL
ncbi:MAG: RNA polymerase sigma factor [Bacteroidota bacterium]